VNDAKNHVPVQPANTANDGFNWIGRDELKPSQGR
jgi:hypothetical protein